MSIASHPRFTVLAGRVLLASLSLIGAGQALAQAAAAPVAAAAAAPAVTPGIPGVVTAGTRIELIKEGFTGTEGPVTLPDGSLIFTETQANRITRIAEDGSTSVFVEGSNGANGLGFTANGDLYAVQVLKPRVGIVFPDPKVRTLADNYEGKPFGRPNDLVVDTQGNVYFTDSGANPATAATGAKASQAAPAKPAVETAKPAVYRISKKGELTRLAADIERPNGIQLSPDDAGRLYVASNTGIQVFSAKGEPLGTIALPKQPQNLAFAGEDKKTLYVVGRGAVYRFPVLTPGFAGRAK
jgi:gluconolactonase